MPEVVLVSATQIDPIALSRYAPAFCGRKILKPLDEAGVKLGSLSSYLMLLDEYATFSDLSWARAISLGFLISGTAESLRQCIYRGHGSRIFGGDGTVIWTETLEDWTRILTMNPVGLSAASLSIQNQIYNYLERLGLRRLFIEYGKRYAGNGTFNLMRLGS